MLMTRLDWALVIVVIGALSWFSLRTVRHMRSVADFLAANRSAGRYLLTIAGGMAALGAISAVAIFEQYYDAGFPVVWWSWMMIPAVMMITLTGWMFYRFRETRCLTLAQFFELRYSRRFRIYSGFIVWFSGILNFGIFPYVAANFFVYFCGFPERFMLGPLGIPTYWPIMLVTMGLALLYTCIGGQITVMLTDAVQGLFCGVALLILCFYLLNHFSWPQVVESLNNAPLVSARQQAQDKAVKAKTRYEAALKEETESLAAEKKAAYEAALVQAEDESFLQKDAQGRSMMNPFDTGRAKNFNFWFFLILVFNLFYGAMSWQGSQAYQSSGINPHEQKMGGIIGIWRSLLTKVALVLLAVTALTFLTHPAFSGQAAAAKETLAALHAGDSPQLAVQQRVPIALGYMLPSGLRGLFCLVMLFLLVTTQDTYLHSWGSIFVQDVIMPWRKTPMTPKGHVSALRWSIVSVAVFAFIFACFYKPSDFIQMYFAITGAIIAGIGAVIIGGLYWKRGTTSAAYISLTIGAVLALSDLSIEQFKDRLAAMPSRGFILQQFHRLNGISNQHIWFYITMICILAYVVVSLLTSRRPFNMDRMLHRGRYDTKSEHPVAKDAIRRAWLRFVGITEEFTRTDRILAISLVVWNVGWLSVFFGATIYHYTISTLAPEWWSSFWYFWIWLEIILSVPATIWFTIGGIADIKRVFSRLATLTREDLDDGRIIAHHMADEDA